MCWNAWLHSSATNITQPISPVQISIACCTTPQKSQQLAFALRPCLVPLIFLIKIKIQISPLHSPIAHGHFSHPRATALWSSGTRRLVRNLPEINYFRVLIGDLIAVQGQAELSSTVAVTTIRVTRPAHVLLIYAFDE